MYNSNKVTIALAAIFFSAFTITQVSAQSLIISTCAGTGVDGSTGDGGLAIAARLSLPVAVCPDNAGNYYISDFGANTIRKVNSSGLINTVAGIGTPGYSGDGGPATAAELSNQEGIAVDGAGNLYIADKTNNVVRKVDASGIITTFAGDGTAGYSGDGGPATAAQLRSPTEVVVSPGGDVFIADAYNYVIRKVSVAGTISTIAGTPDSVGYTGNGGPATAAMIGEIHAMYLDGTGTLYLGESSITKSVIRKIDASGIISLVAGDTSAAAVVVDDVPASATMLEPVYGIAVDELGQIFFTSVWSNKVRKVDVSGMVRHIAGNGEPGFGGFGGDGGYAVATTLAEPTGLCFTAAGELLIADSYNSRVRKVVSGEVAVKQIGSPGDFSVLPNPSTGTFQVDVARGEEIKSLDVLDMSGKVVLHSCYPQGKSGKATVVLPTTVGPGLYFVSAETTKGCCMRTSVVIAP